MTQKLSKLTLSVAASAILTTCSYADDITLYYSDGITPPYVITGNHILTPANNGSLAFITTTGFQHIALNFLLPLGSNDMSGSIGDYIDGAGGLIKEGTGTLTLSGTNFYTGDTIINGGILALSGGNTIVDSGIVTVNASGTLQIDTAETIGTLEGAGAVVLNAGITTGSNNTDATLSGIISGTGSLTKEGSGTLTLSGTNTYSGGTTVNAGTLKGDTTSLQGTITNNATVEFAQNSNGTYSNVMSGTGALTKSGTGTLTLSGTNTYTGATTINTGTLAVTGDTSTSAFSVNNGGTLAGSGTVGSTTVASGGTLAPTGTSTLNIAGNLTMNSGSALNINAYADGTNSKIAATGTATINGGTVAVHADGAGTWNDASVYTVVSATGGVSGTFTSVTDDLAFLDPALSYESSAVKLTLTRNDTDYVDVVTPETMTYSQIYAIQVANTLDNGAENPNSEMQALYRVLDSMSVEQAREAIRQLGGTPLSTLSHLSPMQIRTFTMSLQNRMNGGGVGGGIGLAALAFADNSDMATTFRYLADAGAIGANGYQEPQKIGDNEVWVRAVGGQTMTDGDASRNLSDATTTTGGLQVGVDKRTDDWIVGASLGYLHSNVDQSGLSGDVDSYQLGFYASKDTKEYRLSLNAIGGKYDNHSSRVTPTGMANADYDGTAISAEIKAAYKVPLNATWTLEPALGGWVQRYVQDAYTENGAIGSNLSVNKEIFTSQALTTELKLINTFGESKADKGTLETAIGYSRESGDINAPLVGRFSAAPSAGSFSIASAERGHDVLTAMVGGDMSITANTRLFAMVNGNWRTNEEGYSAMAGIKIGF